MRPSSHQKFQVHPHDRDGTWESNHGRYRAYAHLLLNELEDLCKQVLVAWPAQAGQSITTPESHPELWELTRKRDRASDTTRIYAAMAIEGFLNFYGVLRLGHVVYDDHFERLGIAPKIHQLLLVCDGVDMPKNHILCVHANAVAQSRNWLVHPKTIEITGDPAQHVRSSTKVPEAARESITSMEAFLSEFVKVVPDAKRHVERAGVV